MIQSIVRIACTNENLAEEENGEPDDNLAEEENGEPDDNLAEEENEEPDDNLAEEENGEPDENLAEEENGEHDEILAEGVDEMGEANSRLPSFQPNGTVHQSLVAVPVACYLPQRVVSTPVKIIEGNDDATSTILVFNLGSYLNIFDLL